MANLSRLRVLAVLVCTVLIMGCGAESRDELAEGGIEGTGITDDATHISIGSISGFGSIFVNGIEYETDSSSVVMNDNFNGVEDDLKLGMIVTVEGRVNDEGSTGVANRILFDRDAEGPISSITVTNSSHKLLVILGLDVSVSDDIVFEGVSFEGLTLGQVIEVSGLIDADDTLIASRIEKRADSHEPGDKVEVEAKITSVDLSQRRFTMQSLTVDYSQANLVKLPNLVPNEGDFVEVKGSNFTDQGVLVAAKVKFKGEPLNVEDGDELEIEGVITRFTSLHEFTVHGVTVNAENAEFKKGSDADLAEGTKVEIEGRMSSNNVLIAAEVTVKNESLIKLTAPILSVDSVNGLVNLISVDVSVDNQTVFQDSGPKRLKFFNLGDVDVGDWLKIRATLIGSDVIASRVTRIVERQEVTLKGSVQTIEPNTLTILGVSVDISNIDMAEKNNIVVGSSISVTGQLSENTVVAIELENEDEDENGSENEGGGD